MNFLDMSDHDRAEDKPTTYHGEDGGYSSGEITKSKGVKGHCKRWWWVHLLILVVIVVVVVPCIILVAVPNMAQHRVNKAKLNVDSIVISEPAPGSLHMAINSSLSNVDDSIKATVAAFEGTFYLMDIDPPMAFAQVNFPAVVTDQKTKIVNISQELTISNMTALTTFNDYLFLKDNLTVRVKGDTHIKVSGISRNYPVTFSKDVPMTGFGGLKDVVVTNEHVRLASADNFNATAYIPNPTIWTIDVGNTTYHTYLDGEDLGSTYILNMNLAPGNTSFFIWSDLNETAIINALQRPPGCQTGDLTFDLSGKSVLSDNQNISYFLHPLASTNVTVVLPVAQTVKQDIGVSYNCSGSTKKRSLELW